MAWDDPVVWILIIAVVIFLFGANKIPQLARGFGQARREFERASKGLPMEDEVPRGGSSPAVVSSVASESSDPLIVAAQKEGLVTEGKTREQIASELSWKISKK